MLVIHLHLLGFQLILFQKKLQIWHFHVWAMLLLLIFITYSLVITYFLWSFFFHFAGHDLYALYMFNYHACIWFIAWYYGMPFFNYRAVFVLFYRTSVILIWWECNRSKFLAYFQPSFRYFQTCYVWISAKSHLSWVQSFHYAFVIAP